jgi:hypothetical protein
MHRIQNQRKFFGFAMMAFTLLAASVTVAAAKEPDDRHQTSMFQGAKANKGFAMHYRENGVAYLEASPDFVIPDTPAPHWQVVDSKGNVYLLQSLKVKDNKNNSNRKIAVPKYIHDIAKVQIYCSWAEALLGEASFSQPVK